MAFIWILVLLAIVSALSLSFLQKAATGTAAAVSRGTAIKAHYLARSGANHALWRLLNDPAFSPSGTDYDMHGLGDGRYGYKVRKPTLTTFGTVATVGAVGETVSRQSYVQYLKPYTLITTYDEYGLSAPKYRRLLGASWVDAASAIDDGANNSQYMVLKGCPKRKEMIMATLDTAEHLNLAVWDGSAWGNLKEFTTLIGESIYRCFDIAYENLSGDALVVSRYDNANTVRYNIWNGTDWAFAAAQDHAGLSNDSGVTFLTMASKPNSDEILIAWVQYTNDLWVVQWNGSTFTGLGEIDNDTATDKYGTIAVIYEQQSGDALLLWNHKNTSRIYYRVWNGSVMSDPATAPDFGAIPYVIRAAADPTSDYIFVAAVDDRNDLNVAVWDGNTWIDSRELSTDVSDNDCQILDVAWEDSGEDVMVAWGDSTGGNNVRYFTWHKGTALADHAVQSGPDYQAAPSLVRLQPIANTEKIVLLAVNASLDLRYSLWTGNTFMGSPGILLESELGTGHLPFDIAESTAP